MPAKFFFVLLLHIVFSFISCGSENSITSSNYPIPVSGSIRWISGIIFYDPNGVELPHDNRILESENFLTFSDANSDAVKIELSKMAEESLAEVMEAFGIDSSSELGISRRDTKITIYANNSTYPGSGSTSFPYGTIFPAKGSSAYLAWPEYRRERYRNVVKHETMHVFQLLFGLYAGVRGKNRPPMWFQEGIAEYISGGAFVPIESIEELEEWIMGEHWNPLDIVTGEDWQTLVGAGYYPLYHLAVKYLLDDKGLGKSYSDVKLMFEYMLINHDFNSSFEKCFGISVEYFRNNYFDLMRDFMSN